MPRDCDQTAGEGWALPGLFLLHELHFSVPNWAAAQLVAERLRTAGADVQSLTFERRGASFSGRCRLTGISSPQARALASDLAAGGVTEQTPSVEHLMLAGGARA